MKTRKTLFTDVGTYYQNLITELSTAQEMISMMYYAFDYGEWAEKIGQVLMTKAQAGVQVRLMADGFGQILDRPRNTLKNPLLIRDLQADGVQVDIFKPRGHGLTKLNRLHCKVCAIDDRTVFLGGSNIGDHYPTWDDSNLRLDGPLGNVFHQVYDFVRKYTTDQHQLSDPNLDVKQLLAGDCQVWMTVPRQRQDIRQALLKLIREAEKKIYIRTWYFLPDQEILDALLAKAKNGVEVNILLSHKTRVRPIDFANYIQAHKLAKAGARVFRFSEKYMHAKVVWNEQGDVLFGSANLENVALKNTFECCVAVRDQCLATHLCQAFEVDTRLCIRQTPEIFRRKPPAQKVLSYACSLAAPWL